MGSKYRREYEHLMENFVYRNRSEYTDYNEKINNFWAKLSVDEKIELQNQLAMEERDESIADFYRTFGNEFAGPVVDMALEQGLISEDPRK